MDAVQTVSIPQKPFRTTAWALVVSMLMYPLLTYLATPLVQRHGDGQWTVVCTLQGEKAVFVDFGASPSDAPASCAAVKLLQVVASAAPLAPPALPTVTRLAVSTVAETATYPYHAPHVSVFTSRAPPLS